MEQIMENRAKETAVRQVSLQEGVLSSKRKWTGRILKGLVYFSAALTVLLLVGIIGYVLVRGIPNITAELLTTAPSALKGTIGILPNILNTLYLVVISLIIVLPLGIGAAIYLTEYASGGPIVRLIEFTAETLSGIPSIIYGLAGMLFFCQKMKLQTSILSGALTLVIMILPIIIRTTQESLRTVPQSYREGALGLGATKWYMIRTIILPNSLDGIINGCILSAGRIVGESAALIFTAGIGAVITTNIIEAMSRSGGSLSVALYVYVFERGEFDVGFAIASILMILVLCLNFCTKQIGRRRQRKEKAA